VSGLLVTSAATYGLSLLAGLTTATVIGGPLVVLGAALAGSLLTVDPRAAWYASWVESRDGWSQHVPWFSIAALTAGVAVVTAIFAHTVYSDPGGLEAGYPTVWADWSQHLTTASSFVAGGNIPPTNPLFSGTSLLYPFLPDFHAATLMTLGLAPGLALAIPGGVLMVVIGMLVVALGRRLGLGTGAGVVALLICFIGGGVGFVGAFADACTVPRVHRHAVHVSVRGHPSGHRSVDRRMDAPRPSRDDRGATPCLRRATLRRGPRATVEHGVVHALDGVVVASAHPALRLRRRAVRAPARARGRLVRGTQLGGLRPRRRARRPAPDRAPADADRTLDPAVRTALATTTA